MTRARGLSEQHSAQRKVSPSPEQLTIWLQAMADEMPGAASPSAGMEIDPYPTLPVWRAGLIIPLLILLLALLYLVAGPAALLPIGICLSLLLTTALR
jgi:hypothetical protein